MNQANTLYITEGSLLVAARKMMERGEISLEQYGQMLRRFKEYGKSD